MAGDLNVVEAVALEQSGAPQLRPQDLAEPSAARVIHRYGQLNILARADGESPAGVARVSEFGARADLGEVERLGLAALELRESEDFKRIKRNRPRAGEPWEGRGCTTVVPTPES